MQCFFFSLSYFFLFCLSIFAHLPSYNPLCLWLLCRFSHFRSLCLIPSLSFSQSCLPLRQPEYDNVISHSSTSLPSPLFFSLPPPVSLCLVSLSPADSAALHVSLPLLLILSVTSYAHICTHTPQKNHASPILSCAVPVRRTCCLPAFPFLLHSSDFLINPSSPSVSSLDIPMPPFFSLTSSSLLHSPPASPSLLHLY